MDAEDASNITSDGYIHRDSEEIGNRIATTPPNPLTPENLAICVDFLDPAAPVLTGLISTPTLVGGLTLSLSERGWCFLPKRPSGGFLVVLWAPGSEATFYAGSQNVDYTAGEYSSSKEKMGYDLDGKGVPRLIEATAGGISIIDFSLTIQVVKGYALVYAFGDLARVSKWPKSVLPVSMLDQVK